MNNIVTREKLNNLQKKHPIGISINAFWSNENPELFLYGSVHHTSLMEYSIITENQSLFFIDASACKIRKDNKQIIAVVVKDSNNTFQDLSLGVLQNNSTEAYIDYLQDLKQQINEKLSCSNFYPYAFICDRCQAQINAIKTVFPNSKIVYCRGHLRKNFQTTYRSFSDICIFLMVKSQKMFLLQVLKKDMNR